MTARRSVRGPQVNLDLSELPGEVEIIRAVLDLPEIDSRARRGVTANLLAQHLKVEGARRLGRGAQKGSWSGTMSGSIRLSPRLLVLVKRGLLGSYRDRENYRAIYTVTAAGRALIGAD